MFEIERLDFGLFVLVGSSSLDDPLEASIAKWKQVVAFYEDYPDSLLEDGGGQTCALCQEYLLGRGTDGACVDCPVMQTTGSASCFDTPFRTYRHAVDVEDSIAACLAAEEELEFLRSLR